MIIVRVVAVRGKAKTGADRLVHVHHVGDVVPAAKRQTVSAAGLALRNKTRREKLIVDERERQSKAERAISIEDPADGACPGDVWGAQRKSTLQGRSFLTKESLARAKR